MWQLFALGSLVANAIAEAADKAAFVANKKVDGVVATFWRILFVAIMASIVGFAGWLGELSFTFSVPIILIGIASAIQSLAYTRILRTVEVVEIGALLYAMPLVFLFIDIGYVHTAFSSSEMLGIVLLVIGGLGFALDGKSRAFGSNFSLVTFLLFVLCAAYAGAQAYLFKYMYAQTGITVSSFFASYTTVAAVSLLIFIIVTGKLKHLTDTHALAYLPRVGVSKLFDTANNLLWAEALTLAAVSQVSAMQALNPVIVFIVAIVAQDVFRISLKERLDRSRLEWKLMTVVLLAIGGYLVS